MTPSQQDFIREHWREMHDSEIAEILKVRAFYVHKFRVENRLMKNGPHGIRVFKGEGKIFRVEEVENWLV